MAAPPSSKQEKGKKGEGSGAASAHSPPSLVSLRPAHSLTLTQEEVEERVDEDLHTCWHLHTHVAGAVEKGMIGPADLLALSRSSPFLSPLAFLILTVSRALRCATPPPSPL